MRNQHIGLLILRLSLGIMLLLHGISKVTRGVGSIKGRLADAGLPEFIAYGVYLGEVVAPLLLIIGFRTRMAAAVFAINMLVILFLAHSADIFKLGKSGAWAAELVGLFLFGAIALIFTGGGKYALSTSHKWD